MKKFYLFAAVAGVVLAGCAKVEKTVTGEPGNVPIVFEPVANNLATKAAIPGEVNTDYSIGTGTKQYESFKVWAGYKKDAAATNIGEIEGDFFSGVVASPNNDSSPTYWSAENAYWPKEGTETDPKVYLSFHAFSPSDLTPTHTWANGFTLANYEVKANVAEQIDILYSDYEMNKKRSDYVTSDDVYDENEDETYDGFQYHGVNINFHHALSSIKFKVKTAADYTLAGKHTFTVKAIRIGYAYTTGNFHENRPSDATGTANEYASASAIIENPGTGFVTVIDTWNDEVFSGSNDGNNTYKKHPYWSVSTEPELTPTGSPWSGGCYTIYNDSGVNATASSEDIGNTVLAMPQPLAHGTNNVQVQVVYDYVCKTATDTEIVKLENQVKTIDLHNLSGVDDKEGAQTINTWLINHRYTYDIVFKLDQIIFDPKVVDYIDVTIGTVTVD